MTDIATPSPSAGRYSLAEDGQIFLQADSTNPLPGQPVGKIAKGESLLAPTSDYAPAQDWLQIHIRTVLEPLFLLKQEAGEGVLPEGVTREIAHLLYDNLGVMQRQDLSGQIAKLDPDLRKALRAKGVRLGPILVFLPALVKPAAIKLRALLWGVWNDKTLPVVRPMDGRVSEVIDANAIDRNFYRMIGYPVFGPRAIRIDMLDRVVTDVYDTAQQGVFEAKHKYAEWLGTNLDDLHSILESMGHKKMKAEDPRPDEVPVPQTPTETPVPDSEPAHPEPGPAETPPPMVDPARPDEGPMEVPQPDMPGEIPMSNPVVGEAVAHVVAAPKNVIPLAKFMLKRGRMADTAKERAPRAAQDNRKRRAPKKAANPNANVPQLLTDEDKARIAKREEERRAKYTKFDAKKSDSNDRPREYKGKPKFDKKREDDGSRQGNAANNEGRIYSFEATKKAGEDDGNPFAILKNLKK